MTNIKTKLIHWLGGVTKKECNTYVSRAKQEAHKEEQWIALYNTLKFMEDEYGNPEWGSVVYNYVVDALQKLVDNR